MGDHHAQGQRCPVQVKRGQSGVDHGCLQKIIVGLSAIVPMLLCGGDKSTQKQDIEHAKRSRGPRDQGVEIKGSDSLISNHIK